MVTALCTVQGEALAIVIDYVIRDGTILKSVKTAHTYLMRGWQHVEFGATKAREKSVLLLVRYNEERCTSIYAVRVLYNQHEDAKNGANIPCKGKPVSFPKIGLNK